MNSPLQPKSVNEVGQIMAEYLNKDWCKDREKILRYINELRELIYLEFPKLFTDRFYCCKLQCFKEDCLITCECPGPYYKGITIPLDIDGVLDVWADTEPLKNRSKWYEGREGRQAGATGTCLETILMHEAFPTEKAMPKPGYLKMFTHSEHDNGKVAVIKVKEGKDACSIREIQFELKADAMVASGELVFGIESVVLPDNLKGCVSLYVDDEEISCYPPGTSIPSYRRLKVTTPCDVCQVLLHGSQKFKDVCFDTDIVEIGSRVMLKEAAKIFRYGDMGTEQDEIAKGMRAESKLKALIKAAIERNRGNSNQDGSQFLRADLMPNTNLYSRVRSNKYRRSRINPNCKKGI